MIYQLKIELKDIKPNIWRRIQVDSNISLNELHHIIQISMGWTNSHLYSLIIDNIEYTVKEYDAEYVQFANARDYTIEKVRIDGDFDYLYDFGDRWEHRIQIEKKIEGERLIDPICLDGEGKCPPEDVGGINGFIEFVKIIRDESHPERESYIEWYGSVYDPNKVNFEEINEQLANLDQYISKIESNED